MSKKNPSSMATADSDWEARSDMRTLMEAETIKRDAKRLAAAKACAKKQLEEVAAVASTVASQSP